MDQQPLELYIVVVLMRGEVMGVLRIISQKKVLVGLIIQDSIMHLLVEQTIGYIKSDLMIIHIFQQSQDEMIVIDLYLMIGFNDKFL